MQSLVKRRRQSASNITVVKKGSALVRIYPIKNRGRIHHSVTWFFEGKRQRRSFVGENAAKREAATIANQLNFGNAQILTLRSTDRASYLAARDLLVANRVADCIQSVPQTTKWQRFGNQINAAFIVTWWPHFVNVHGTLHVHSAPSDCESRIGCPA